MTRARLALENLDWHLGSARYDLAQLELLINPPDPDAGPRHEVVKRPPPFSAGNFEIIEMPPPAAGSTAAA